MKIFFNFSFFVDEHFEIKSKGTIHTLTIRNVAWNEGGEYKCLADGGAKTSATLIVKGKLNILVLFFTQVYQSDVGSYQIL